MARGNKRRAQKAINAALIGNVPGFNLYPDAITILKDEEQQQFIIERIAESGGPTYESHSDFVEDLKALGYRARGDDEFGITLKKD